MHSEMCPVRQNQIQRTVRTAHLSSRTITTVSKEEEEQSRRFVPSGLSHFLA